MRGLQKIAIPQLTRRLEGERFICLGGACVVTVASERRGLLELATRGRSLRLHRRRLAAEQRERPRNRRYCLPASEITLHVDVLQEVCRL